MIKQHRQLQFYRQPIWGTASPYLT